MQWLDGAMPYGPCCSQLIFVGDADEDPDGGSPFIEPLHSRRKVEEQLCVPELLLVWAAVKAVWTVTRFDF